MDDEEKTVADYKIVENGFIVMMVAKVGTLLDSFSLKFCFHFTSNCTFSFFLTAIVDKSVQFERLNVK